MRTLTQFLFAAASFVAVFFIGMVFDMEFGQAEFRLEERILDGPPLPGLTRLFMGYGYLSTLLLSLPWFVLLGCPLLFSSAGTGYRSAVSFETRYLAFLSIELFSVFFIILALLMPFISHYGVMKGSERKWSDMIPSAVFWLGSLILLVAIVRAFVKRKRNSGAAARDS